ncbi:DUF4331 family protein [Micromonospora sp. NPDC050417]|uniref:DUF4331 family protein n=1 Tax=Micromonospora sp. NPDC050417 TaxID=3364280 RepID=UPI0037A98188
MSHHLDSPLAREDSRLDLTDQFVFRGDTGTVFVMNVNSSAYGKDGKPGFHPEGRYEIKIHLDGSPVEELTYRLTFEEMDSDGEQALTLYALTGPDASDDSATGDMIAQGRTHAPISGANGVRVWAGKANDPFYIDLKQLEAIDAAVRNGAKLDFAGWQAKKAKNSFAGTTIHSIVIEVPDGDPLLGTDRDICTWIATKLATDAGGWRQINREGHPMVWPIFRPVDSEWASDANMGHPDTDITIDGEQIAQLVAGVVAANGTADDPDAYGRAVADRLLPDLLPYRLGTTASFGFLGFNGRTLADNAPETMFSLALNTATTSGLSAEQFADTRSDQFPYVVAAG